MSDRKLTAKSNRRMTKTPMSYDLTSRTFEALHAAGARRFAWLWIEANTAAIASAYQSGARPSDPALKEFMSRLVLAVLRAIAPQFTLRLITTAPRDGSFVLLFGDSGYVTTPLRCEVGHWIDGVWRTHANDHFTDGGPAPLYWLPLPSMPEQPEKGD